MPTTSSTSASCRTCSRTSGADARREPPCGQRGQSSVEAALTLPTLMILVAFLVQPACALYTRMVMRHAAAEAVRVLSTSGDPELCRSFALRRLRAVPQASVFHVGGEADWQIRVERDEAHMCEVRIGGHLRPLPLFGVSMQALGSSDDVGVLMEVGVRERTRPRWLGGEYEDWMEAW